MTAVAALRENDMSSGPTLIGQYDSPFVRRVGVSMHVLGMPFTRNPLSVFRNAEEMRHINPLGRVPALILDDGEALIDSAAILDHLDDVAGAERALVPRIGRARRDALQLMALGAGVAEKMIDVTIERWRAPDKLDAQWVARGLTQIAGGLVALDARVAAQPALADWGTRPSQAAITVVCALGYVRLRDGDALLPPGRYRALDRLAEAWEPTAPFRDCRPTVAEIGGDPSDAAAALARLNAPAAVAPRGDA